MSVAGARTQGTGLGPWRRRPPELLGGTGDRLARYHQATWICARMSGVGGQGPAPEISDRRFFLMGARLASRRRRPSHAQLMRKSARHSDESCTKGDRGAVRFR